MDFLELLQEKIESNIKKYGSVKNWRIEKGMKISDETLISRIRSGYSDVRLTTLLRIIESMDCELTIKTTKKSNPTS